MGNEVDYWLEYLEKSKPEMLPENYDLIRRHIRKMRSAKMREATISNHLQVLTQFATWCKTPFNALSDDDILSFSEWLDRQTFTKGKKKKKYSEGTKYIKLATIKAFLRELKISAASAITMRPVKHKKLPEDLLTQEEVEALLNECRNTRDRALIAVLYESGMRRGELLNLRIKNISFDENGTVVTIPDGKTGARRIRLVFATSFIREWLAVHPNKNRESFVFCSTREPFDVMSYDTVRHQLQNIAKRAGIQKRVNPHSFRHARATHLAEHLTEAQMKTYLGWTAGSNMAAVYVHLSGKNIDNAILKMNGIEIDETHADGFKVGRCPRCKELNPEADLFCGKCGMPLKQEAKDRIEKDKEEIDMSIMQAIALDPKVLEALAREIVKQQNNKNKA